MTGDMLATLVNLGSAGAVIIVVVIFLKSIKERDDEWRSFFTTINDTSRRDIEDMRSASDHIVASLDKVINMVGAQDTRAVALALAIDNLRNEMTKFLVTYGVKRE